MARRNLDDQDYISSLADEVITRILSRIPTKSAVATSLLSKRWKHLWTWVPNLDFRKYSLKWRHSHYYENNAEFERFVDRVLTLNLVSRVRKIRLHHSTADNPERFDSWITSITNRDAEVIDLNVPLDFFTGFLPDRFFNKTSLVKLKLASMPCKIPQSVSFPNLKTIHLFGVNFCDENSIQKLLFGCPVLKNLCIELSDLNERTFDICSSTLHSLRLRQNNYTNGRLVVVDAPHIRDFHIEETHLGPSCKVIDLSSMVKLYICLHGMSSNHLTNMPNFCNLSHLTFKIKEEQWTCLALLLHLAPKLATLNLITTRYSSIAWSDPKDVPHCMSCLESVEFAVYFSEGGQEGMMKMVSYFLKNANVMKKLSIDTHLAAGKVLFDAYVACVSEKKSELVKTLLSFPRSFECQVYFDGDEVI